MCRQHSGTPRGLFPCIKPRTCPAIPRAAHLPNRPPSADSRERIPAARSSGSRRGPTTGAWTLQQSGLRTAGTMRTGPGESAGSARARLRSARPRGCTSSRRSTRACRPGPTARALARPRASPVACSGTRGGRTGIACSRGTRGGCGGASSRRSARSARTARRSSLPALPTSSPTPTRCRRCLPPQPPALSGP